MFAQDFSLALTLATLLLGWLAGVCATAFSNGLPQYLERTWQAEAAAALNQASDELPPIAWRWSCKSWLPWANAVFAAMLAIRFGPTLTLVASLVLVWTLLLLAEIDRQTTYLPDLLTLPLLWLGLLFNLTGNVNGLFCPLPEAVLGAVAGYVSLWLLFWGFKLSTGQEGMGYGDFKLLAALGAWFGWTALPSIAFVAAVAGALVGGFMLWQQRQHPKLEPAAYPFGPYLVLAGLLYLLWPIDLFAALFAAAPL